MAYIGQEQKAKIAEVIKPLLKKYGLKGSLSIRHHSTIYLKITEGPIDFSCGKADLKGYIQVSEYHLESHYTGTALEFLKQAVDALRSADWYDRSDAQVDHFDTAYYIGINVGGWSKPYKLTV
jgi:plastocyanin domain-containing protein